MDNLRIDYAVAGDTLSCIPVGRIDTISAPVLLEILELLPEETDLAQSILLLKQLWNHGLIDQVISKR